MTNTIRKIARASAAMLVIVMTIVSLFSIPASAATAWPSMSSSKYCEFIAPKNINVYRNTSFAAKDRGTCSPAKSYNALIEKNDKCKIYAATSSYLKVAYPTSSGQRIGYIKRSDLFGVSSPSERVTSQNKVNTASVKGGARSYGYIAKGDNVWNVGTSGSWTAVIYDAKSGSRAYKLGFIPSSEYSSKVKKPATTPKTTTPKTTTPNKSSSGLVSPVPAGCYFTNKTSDAGWYGYHDINRNVSSSTPVYAITDGTAYYYQAYRTDRNGKYLSSYGNHIEFVSTDNKTKAIYAHLSSFYGVKQKIPSSRTKNVSGWEGREPLGSVKVKAGQILGYIGTTGHSSGNHLHFELRINGVRVDPTSKISGLVK